MFPALATWRTTISYFEKKKKIKATGPKEEIKNERK
jgi:hypothetical protein